MAPPPPISKTEPTPVSPVEGLATILQVTAGSGSLDSFEYAHQQMVRNDPKIVAQALLRIPKSATAAALLLPFRRSRPAYYDTIGVWMDFFSDPVRPNRRDQISRWERWLPMIQVVDASFIPANRVLAAEAATLSLLAAVGADRQQFRIHQLPQQSYPEIGISVIATYELVEPGNSLPAKILVRGKPLPSALGTSEQPVDVYETFGFDSSGKPAGDRYFNEDYQTEHRAKRSDDYAQMIRQEAQIETVQDREEAVDASGNLIVRSFREADIFYYIFDPQGELIESGYEEYPENNEE